MTSAVGLTPAHLKAIQGIFQSTLRGEGLIKVYLFGSRARGDHKKYSDVDLLIEGPIDARLLRELRSALEDSRLPFKFDVVPSEAVYPYYRRQIELEKKLLFEMNGAAEPRG